MTNKEVALSFLNLVTSGKVREAYERHAASNFRHHNPYFQGDAVSLQKGMEESETRFPGKICQVKRVIAEGDFVATHSFVGLKKGELEISAVHIFRFEKGKIAEFWDVAQQIPQEMPNQNGMF